MISGSANANKPHGILSGSKYIRPHGNYLAEPHLHLDDLSLTELLDAEGTNAMFQRMSSDFEKFKKSLRIFRVAGRGNA